MKPLLLSFPDDRDLAREIANCIGAETGRLVWHRFPDGESLVSIDEAVKGRDVILVASLRHPDRIALPLRFVVMTAREFGVRSLGLVAPYLAYMRQDRRFHPGEAVSAPLFARFLEEGVDWLVTADPHLHRNPDLSRLFEISTRTVATAPLIADWIKQNVTRPVLIGPDSESKQWVASIAARIDAPYQILEKTRRGDRDVSISIPDFSQAENGTPVIVDDIVSSGRTMIETAGHLRELGLPPAICVIIHPVFAGNAYEELLDAGVASLVSTNSIAHRSNAISIAGPLASAIGELSNFQIRKHGDKN